MNTLDAFQAKLTEYAANNITAYEGRTQITQNEREDLRLLFTQLSQADRAKALQLAAARGLDTTQWK